MTLSRLLFPCRRRSVCVSYLRVYFSRAVSKYRGVFVSFLMTAFRPCSISLSLEIMSLVRPRPANLNLLTILTFFVFFILLSFGHKALESFQAKGDTTSASLAAATPAAAAATRTAPAVTGAPALAAARSGGGEGGGGGGRAVPSTSDAREALRFLFGKDGEFFREFLLDEARTALLCVEYGRAMLPRFFSHFPVFV